MKSFRNPTTNILTAWGFVDTNGDDLARDEAEDFNLEPGKWQLVNDGWVSVEPDRRAAKRAVINAQCDQRINAVVSSYPETEILTFPKQEEEARAYAADPASATPMIDALAASRGVGKEDLVNRILAKVDYFAQYTGLVIGYRQKLEDRVNAASDAELDGIDPLAGWPE
jgi:hypothetical protein